MTRRDLQLLRWVRDATASGEAREIRTRGGWTQAEFGDAVGVAQPTIALWEAGKRRPRGEVALKYARLLRDADTPNVAVG